MRPLKPGEVELLQKTLIHLAGARLQSVTSGNEDVVLEFYLNGSIYFLWFDDSKLRPSLTFWPERKPFSIKKKTSPIQLFLKAHFVGERLSSVSFDPRYGRRLLLQFENSKILEFRIFPHGQNVIASTAKQQLALHKPKDLQPLEDIKRASENLRSVEEFSTEWMISRKPLKLSGKKIAEGVQERKSADQKKYEKKKKSLEKAISKVSEELKRKESNLWFEVATWLKAHGTWDHLPRDFEILVDRKKSIHKNIDQLFAKSKDVHRKVEGTQQRLKILKEELAFLEKRGCVSGKDILESKLGERAIQGDVKARTLKLDADIKVVCGRSAKDNVDLLRQAKAWDVWFHLKDRPSSHAIAFRPKSKELTPSQIERIIQWFFKEVFGSKFKGEVGQKHRVLIAECRYVKPIRGDRMGRVQYRNEKVFLREVKES